MQYSARKSTRISNFDYSSDHYYFVTICTYDKKCIFGSIQNLSSYGKIAAESVMDMENHHPGIKIDKYVVMPNHIHMIVVIGCMNSKKKNPNLNQVIGAYKSAVSRKIHMLDPNVQVWQRSFHDHVIRGQADYEKIWSYIDSNPMRWEKDCFYMI